jgi:hypothetical protein
MERGPGARAGAVASPARVQRITMRRSLPPGGLLQSKPPALVGSAVRPPASVQGPRAERPVRVVYDPLPGCGHAPLRSCKATHGTLCDGSRGSERLDDQEEEEGTFPMTVGAASLSRRPRTARRTTCVPGPAAAHAHARARVQSDQCIRVRLAHEGAVAERRAAPFAPAVSRSAPGHSPQRHFPDARTGTARGAPAVRSQR